MKNRWASGSYTLEAAMILPTILLLTAGVIYFGFHLHDRIGIQASLYTFSMKLHMKTEEVHWEERYLLASSKIMEKEIDSSRVRILLEYENNPLGRQMKMELKNLDNSARLRKSRAVKGENDGSTLSE